MGNLIKMELHKIPRIRTFQVTLVLSFLIAVAESPALLLLSKLMKIFSDSEELSELFPKTVELSSIIEDPFGIGCIIAALVSVYILFYVDQEAGYIKNIAGQMPKRGYTVLAKFFAIIPHNLLFMLVSLCGKLLGTLIVQKIVITGDIMESIGTFFVKLLLMQAVSTILLLFTTGLRNKSLGSVGAVMMGSGLMSLIYIGLDSALGMVFKNKTWSLENYMPDQLLTAVKPDLMRSVVVSAVTIALFLSLAVFVFDKRDVK